MTLTERAIRPTAEDARATGERIGRYVIRGVLGTGGCAVVYDAEHRATGRRVALKTLRAELVGNEMMQARFRREVRVLGGLQAPNLVDAIDAGTLDDGSPYLVLERLEGPTLDAVLRHGPLEHAAAIEVVRGALEALVVLHAEGIVHRDLKPDNIVIHQSATGPVVKLLDLGVCAFSDDLVEVAPSNRQGALTSAGLWVGTPCYMAPEQVEARAVDARTDVYAAGVVLYECLTGRTPFEGGNTLEIVTAVLRRPVLPVHVVRPNCPASLDTLVLQALTRNADNRPQSARALAGALNDIAAEYGLASGAAALALLPEVGATDVRRRRAPPSKNAPTRSGNARNDGQPEGVVSRDGSLLVPSTWSGARRGYPIVGALLLAAAVVVAAIVVSRSQTQTRHSHVSAPTRERSPSSDTPMLAGDAASGAALASSAPLAREVTTPLTSLGNSDLALEGIDGGAAAATTIARHGPTTTRRTVPRFRERASIADDGLPPPPTVLQPSLPEPPDSPPTEPVPPANMPLLPIEFETPEIPANPFDEALDEAPTDAGVGTLVEPITK